jgi:hypothetical protein
MMVMTGSSVRMLDGSIFPRRVTPFHVVDHAPNA